MVDPDIGERHYSEWAVKRDLGFRFVVSSTAEIDTNICFRLDFFLHTSLFLFVIKINPWFILLKKLMRILLLGLL